MFKTIDENSVDYEKDKNIDIHDLHFEFMRQPSLVGNYYKLRGQAEDELENARRKVDIAKADLDRAKSNLELNIRKTPSNYGWGDKLTENIVASLITTNLVKDEECVKCQTAYSEAQEKLITAKRKFDVYYAATKAIEERRSSLENLVILWTRNYFSVPNLPRPFIEDFANTFQDDKDQKSAEARQEIKETTETPVRRRRD